MNRDRRVILSLMAVGRITPREAERLLAVAGNGDEAVLRLGILLAMAWLVLPQIQQVFTALARVFSAWVPGIAAAHHGLAWISFWAGGVL